VAARLRLPERVARGDGEGKPEEEADGPDQDARELEPALPRVHAGGDERERDSGQDQAERVPEDPDDAREDGDGREEAGDRLGGTPRGRVADDVTLALEAHRLPI